jgi:hypothetical protein
MGSGEDEDKEKMVATRDHGQRSSRRCLARFPRVIENQLKCIREYLKTTTRGFESTHGSQDGSPCVYVSGSGNSLLALAI